ncbi:MAG: hypothetical protein FWG10_13330 [Eubacteriaceae bacterium]|nr:hypothetical protein [Eubacteriaceae bacterium]
MSVDEYSELSCWFWRERNSVHSNPWLLYGEDGRLMDFINDMRIAVEMAANPHGYMPKPGPPVRDPFPEAPPKARCCSTAVPKGKGLAAGSASRHLVKKPLPVVRQIQALWS